MMGRRRLSWKRRKNRSQASRLCYVVLQTFVPNCPARNPQRFVWNTRPGFLYNATWERAWGQARRAFMAAGPVLRILVADDHEDTLSVMSRLLTRAGYEVHTARNIAEARALAAKTRCDLLISDLGLPDGCGEDLMQELKSQYGLRGLAVSGFASAPDREGACRAGFHDLLAKPIQFDELLKAIEDIEA